MRHVVDDFSDASLKEIGRWRKSSDSSVDIVDYPRRNEQILRTYDFILPKFYFALPKNQKNIHEDIEHISVDIVFL